VCENEVKRGCHELQDSEVGKLRFCGRAQELNVDDVTSSEQWHSMPELELH
jgi:hypothetical protein